eukprot:1087618-Pyramimonas_sp.AAC.1
MNDVGGAFVWSTRWPAGVPGCPGAQCEAVVSHAKDDQTTQRTAKKHRKQNNINKGKPHTMKQPITSNPAASGELWCKPGMRVSFVSLSQEDALWETHDHAKE